MTGCTPSQPQRITSGLKANLSLSPSYSFQKSQPHFPESQHVQEPTSRQDQFYASYLELVSAEDGQFLIFLVLAKRIINLKKKKKEIMSLLIRYPTLSFRFSLMLETAAWSVAAGLSSTSPLMILYTMQILSDVLSDCWFSSG